MQTFEKFWKDSLKFLDCDTTHFVLIIILALLVSTLFTNINRTVVDIMDSKISRIIVLLLILYLTPRSPTIGILLAMLYVMSMRGVMEFFESMKKEKKDEEEKQEEVVASEDVTTADQVLDETQQNVPVREDFIPFLSNRDFESAGFHSELKSNCLSTDPNHNELVGDACTPVAAFRGELNAQGMNAITGFNLKDHTSAQPL